MRAARPGLIWLWAGLLVSGGVGFMGCGGDDAQSTTSTSQPAATIPPVATTVPGSTSAPSTSASTATTTSTADPEEKRVAASAIAATDLSDPGTLVALEAVRLTDGGVLAAQEALAAGVTGDPLWAATWIYATAGVDPAPLLPLLASDDHTVQAMAAAALLARGVSEGAAPLAALAADTEPMRGASPPLSIGDYAASSLARYIAGPDIPAGTSPVDAADAWSAWLTEHGSTMTFDESTGRWGG